MKKLLIYSMALMLLFSVEFAFGRSYTFRVLANRGANKVKKAGSGQIIALKIGITLNRRDVLITTAGGYIGLMHKSGKTLEIRKAGTVLVADFEKRITKGKSNVTSRYSAFVSARMNEKKAGGGYRSRLKATGAVSRTANDGSLEVMIPERNNKIIGDHVIIRWEPSSEDITYVVTVSDIQNQTLFTKETDKTHINLDLKTEQMMGQPLYLVTISSKDDAEIMSRQRGIVRVEKDSDLVESLNELKAEISDDSSLNKLIYAFFFEENNLLLDALTKYEEVIQLSPDIEDFQELYANFLLVNGLSQKE